MRRTLSCFVALLILLQPFTSLASESDVFIENNRVFQLGIMGQGVLDLDKELSREELATIAVRLKGLEYLKSLSGFSTPFKDVEGWSVPYVSIAYNFNLISGVKENLFYPKNKVKYVELLTVVMRVLGYEDNIDFKNYPEDYYSKALEIGLGNLYIAHDEIVTRGVAAATINKALDLNLKDSDIKLSSLQLSYNFIGSETTTNSKGTYTDSKIYIQDLSFNANTVGFFSGVLAGTNDFSGYKVVLLTKSGTVLDSTLLKNDGKFSIEGFDVSVLSKILGYKYEVYSPSGTLVLWGDL